MLYYIPIEPYETRYTADWISQFEAEFKRFNVKFETILGTQISNKVTAGGVLDACGTNLYKFSQLSQIISKIQSGIITSDDCIFFADLWFPGIESLFYIRQMLNLSFKIVGIFHAGTYDEHDFTYRFGMRSWGKYIEAGWFEFIDKIFVATEFHKKLLIRNSLGIKNLEDKVFITGLPFYAEELRCKYPVQKKQNILVFPHRCDEEKHPELFDELCEWLIKENINFRPVKTIVETHSRHEYFNLLSKSKVMVSFADQETFGYSTLESMALDNIVVVPNKLSYVETVPMQYRYYDKAQCFNMVKNALLSNETPIYYLEKWRGSIHNMLVYAGVINV